MHSAELNVPQNHVYLFKPQNLFDASVFRLSLLIERRKCYNSNIVLLLTGCSVGTGTGKD